MAIFEKTLLTKQGHQLLSKVLAGKTEMLLTKVQAGDGNFDYETEDVLDLTGLVNPRLDGRIVSVTPTGKYSELKGIITNEKLTAFMEFRELGIFAKDPDADEILFAYANAGEFADPIGPYNGVFLHTEEISIDIYTANVAEIYATITPIGFAAEITYDNAKSGMAAENVQDALDELDKNVSRFYKLFKLKPLDEGDYCDPYFGVMPVDGGPLTTDYGGSMVIDGEDFAVPYTANEEIDAGGFDAEYFGGGSGSQGGGVGDESVLDGGLFTVA